MENSITKSCRLCLNSIEDSNYSAIDVKIKNILDSVLLKLNLDNGHEHFMCTACFKKLNAAFDFKSKCLHNNDIIPYINSQEPSIDLKEIYMKERKLEAPDDEEICRLCIQPIKTELVYVRDVDVDMLLKYIPEVTLSATKNPVMCKTCSDALVIHSSFIKMCLNVNNKNTILEQSDDDSQTVVPHLVCYIKSEHMEQEGEKETITEKCFGEKEDRSNIEKLIKTEEIDSDSSYSSEESLESQLPKDFSETCETTRQIEFVTVKTEYPNESSSTAELSLETGVSTTDNEMEVETVTVKDPLNINTLTNSLKGPKLLPKDNPKIRWHKCAICDFKFKQAKDLKRHMRIHKNPSEIHWYACDVCDFKSKWKHNLEKHMLQHKTNSEIQWYECDMCDYKSKWKKCLDSHFNLKHQDPSEVQLYECDKCDYKSRLKKCLNNHFKQKHQDPSEVLWYKCESCDYKSIRKSDVNMHMLKHKDSSEKNLLRCDVCDFKTMWKSTLRLHVLIHKTDIPFHRCDVCGYKTKNKGRLNKHMFIHKNASEKQWFKCTACDFKSSYKSVLKTHMLVHKDASEIEWFSCDVCDYKAKQKKHLKVHMRAHRDGPESKIRFSKCKECDYESKSEFDFICHMFIHKNTSATRDVPEMDVEKPLVDP